MTYPRIHKLATLLTPPDYEGGPIEIAIADQAALHALIDEILVIADQLAMPAI